MTVKQLIIKLRNAHSFLGIIGEEHITIAMNEAEIELLIAILEEHQRRKGENDK